MSIIQKLLGAFLLCSLILYGGNNVNAKPLSLNEVTEAICRVNAGMGWGSGTCFAQDNDYFYVLTNYHVVTDNAQIKLEFFRRGLKTPQLNAEVIWRAHQASTDVDFAIARIAKVSFGNYPPRVIPLIPRNTALENNSYICAVGCPRADWANGWEGQLKYPEGGKVIFTPAPQGGQSGSGIIVIVKDATTGEYNSRIGAILTWRIDNQLGGAIPIQTLYNAISGRVSATYVPSTYQPVAITDVNDSCQFCNRPYYQHALGDDAKLYCLAYNETLGRWYARPPKGVKIVEWDMSKYCQYGGCPGGSCPLPYGGNISPPPYGIDDSRDRTPFRRNPSPSPNNPSPSPGNPYGSTPPKIPGIDDVPTPSPLPNLPVPPNTPTPNLPLPPNTPTVPSVPVPPNTPTPAPTVPVQPQDELSKLIAAAKSLSDKNAELTKKLEATNKALSSKDSQIKDLTGRLNTKTEPKEVATTTPENADGGVIDTVKKQPLLQVIIAGLGGGLLYLAWNKFIRAKVVTKLDSVEDLIQQKVTDKWGEDAGKESRRVMEGIESTLLSLADVFLEERRLKNQLRKRNNPLASSTSAADKALSILTMLEDEVNKASTKILANKMFTKDELVELMGEFEKTETAENDAVGLDYIQQLKKLVESAPADIPQSFAADLLSKLKSYEQNDSKVDANLLDRIAKLEERLSGTAPTTAGAS